MYQTTLTLQTNGREFKNITQEINQVIRLHGPNSGLCHLFLQHTSASLMIGENSDPDVCTDLEMFMSALVTDGDVRFKHRAEGDDDMSSHIRTLLTETSLMIPIQEQCLALGTWQGIFLWEHRYAAHTRKVIISIF